MRWRLCIVLLPHQLRWLGMYLAGTHEVGFWCRGCLTNETATQMGSRGDTRRRYRIAGGTGSDLYVDLIFLVFDDLAHRVVSTAYARGAAFPVHSPRSPRNSPSRSKASAPGLRSKLKTSCNRYPPYSAYGDSLCRPWLVCSLWFIIRTLFHESKTAVK